MFDTNELQTMATLTIQSILNSCERELDRRRAEERKKFVANFLDAYRALRDAGIPVEYCDECWEDGVRLTDAEAFFFG